MTALLVGVTLLFALVNGMNDGGAITAATLKARGIRPITTVLVLAGAVAVVPVVIGTQVAQTLRSGLLDGDGARLTAAVVTGVVAAMLVVAVVSRMGLPTSLTLAVVGGIVGAGLGLGIPARWSTVAQVAAIGIAAPVVGGLLASVMERVPIGRTSRSLRAFHRGGMLVESTAYAANDGQKMLAVGIVVAPALGWDADQTLPTQLLAAIGACFALGAAIGLRAAASSLAGGVLRQRPRDEVTVEYAAGLAVLGSAALGAPVSMTQSIAGGLVGIGVHRGHRAVRWRVAASLGLAWVVTLPVSAAAGAGAAAAVRVLGVVS